MRPHTLTPPRLHFSTCVVFERGGTAGEDDDDGNQKISAALVPATHDASSMF